MVKLDEKDIGYVEDSVTAFINLCHAEFHAQKSYIETGDKRWMRIADELRHDRSDIGTELTKEDDGELWCWNKHIALVIGAYLERATRDYSDNRKEKAEENYAKAKKWLGVFFVKNKLEGGKK